MENKFKFFKNNKFNKEKKKRLYFLKKIDKEEIPNYPNKEEYLFHNPQTFLNLPNESNFKFVINKTIRGPRYDKNNKIIPYTLIGSLKNISHKGIFSKSVSIRSRHSILKSREHNYNYNNYYTSREYKEISDRDIKNLFNRFKDKIFRNEQKERDFKEHKERNIKEELISDKLKTQENSLKNNKFYLTQIRKIQNKIQRKINFNLRKKKLNESQTKYLSSTNLIMDSINNYFFQKEAKTIIRENKSNKKDNKNKKLSKIKSYSYKNREKNIFSNPNLKWEMSLRRPKNFEGITKKVLNVHTPKNPYWFISTEKSNKNKKYILDSRYNTDNNLYQDKNNCKDDDNSLNKEIKYFRDINTLKINGEKLIDFEENLCKKLKGKKKLYNYKYEEKNIRDLDIFTNYNFRGHSLVQGNKKINE